MIHLFIDSNIWLHLYHYSNDNLEKFEKLKDYLNASITLYFTDQVKNEIARNREGKIKDALNQFEMKEIRYPSFSKDFDIYKKFSVEYKKLLNDFKEWRREIDDCIVQNTLPADKTIHVILDSVSCIPCDKYIDKAVIRYKIGNPPGKDDSYGDAINWECLLDFVPNNEDLHFISDDKDFKSKINDERMQPFLIEEWKEKKKSEIHFYTSLTDFLRKNKIGIELDLATEKQELIKKLAYSPNFVSTHGVIAMLNQYTGWTDDQIEDICDAAESNSQVRWILDDADIYAFFKKLLSNVDYKKLNECATKRVLDWYGKAEQFSFQEDENDFEADTPEKQEAYSIIESMRSQIENEIEIQLSDDLTFSLDGMEYDSDGIASGHDYDYIEYIEHELNEIEIFSIDHIDNNVIAAKLKCTIIVKAECSYEDYDNGVWDPEEKEYIYLDTITNIEKHKGCFPCSILIDRSQKTIQVVQFHLYLGENTRQGDPERKP